MRYLPHMRCMVEFSWSSLIIIRNGLVLEQVAFTEQDFILGSRRINFTGKININFIQLRKVYISRHPHISNGILLDPQNCLGLVGF